MGMLQMRSSLVAHNRIAALIVSAVAVLALTACGGGTSKVSKGAVATGAADVATGSVAVRADSGAAGTRSLANPTESGAPSSYTQGAGSATPTNGYNVNSQPAPAPPTSATPIQPPPIPQGPDTPSTSPLSTGPTTPLLTAGNGANIGFSWSNGDAGTYSATLTGKTTGACQTVPLAVIQVTFHATMVGPSGPNTMSVTITAGMNVWPGHSGPTVLVTLNDGTGDQLFGWAQSPTQIGAMRISATSVKLINMGITQLGIMTLNGFIYC
jgi:hypothetical protein